MSKIKDIIAGKNPFSASEQMTCPNCKGSTVLHIGPRTFIVPTPKGKIPVVVYDVKNFHCPKCGTTSMSEAEKQRVESLINQALGI